MNCTKVDFGPPRGRGIVASRACEAGEILFTEKPLICCQFSWNRLYGYQACDHCMCPLETAEINAKRLTGNPSLTIPHAECGALTFNPVTCPDCGSWYCSTTCMKEAASVYHCVVCPRQLEIAQCIQELDELWRQLHYPPETSTIMLLVRIAGACLSACFRQSVQSKQIVEALNTFVSATTEQIKAKDLGELTLSHKLLRPEFFTSLEQLHNKFTDVLICLTKQFAQNASDTDCRSMLQQAGIDALLNVENFKSALCLLGRNGQGIATSAFSLWAKGMENLAAATNDNSEIQKLDALLTTLYTAMEAHVGTFLDNEGVGLYDYQRLINHSCDPNAVVQFTGANSTLSVVTLRPIQIGEEITISYLDGCQQSRSRHSRRKLLCSDYLFWCECPKCESEKPPDGVLSETSVEEDEDEDSVEDDENAVVPQTEDTEVKRKRLAEAAERRAADSQARGLANPESARRKQQRTSEQERLERTRAVERGDFGLRWNVN
ncbi:hypothetical protein P879_05557 [Paragonimus westermani]|uniref:SET domain-containing protein n=1 Tax=Paragonimus westermani TaxID=34504 RepID=A0A8T0DQG4_9TREM|nr:hypothetical protein P879_05557 [Paragonimus westermani]